jgi:hypothetical protein
MKKREIVLLLTVLISILLVSFAFCQVDGSNPSTTPGIKNPADNITGFIKGDVDKEVKEVQGSLRKAEEDLDNAFEKEMNIPEKYKKVVHFFTGIEDKIAGNILIIFISTWILLFIIILEICKTVPFFSGEYKSLFAGFLIMLIISASGAVYGVSVFYYHFFSGFKLLKDWSILATTLVVFSFIIIYVIFQSVMRYVYRVGIKEKAKDSGAKIGGLVEMAEEAQKPGDK